MRDDELFEVWEETPDCYEEDRITSRLLLQAQLTACLALCEARAAEGLPTTIRSERIGLVAEWCQPPSKWYQK